LIDDPIETEQWLALNAYLCFCSAWGCFSASMYAVRLLGVYLDELFYMGFAFMVAGAVLLILADFKIPTAIWRYVVTKRVLGR